MVETKALGSVIFITFMTPILPPPAAEVPPVRKAIISPTAIGLSSLLVILLDSISEAIEAAVAFEGI
ncbi:hypothetical protein [Bacteroides sp. 224]|uniref:hypothetical protein n=1 Tax=Bacteroides sp. 224 TaxID=2302936 RepID=UPI0013CF41B9|nr:hypothetical protein [Bacteroides sp. 224]